MSESPYARVELPSLSVGVFGHPGSGKRSLLSALERALELRGWELARAPASAWSPVYATSRSAARRYAWIVFREPVTKKFKESARLIDQVDAGLLVISAEDGVMPATRAYAELAARLGVRRWVVVVTKIDLLYGDDDMLELTEADARELLSELGAEGDDVVVVRTASGHDQAIVYDQSSPVYRALLRVVSALDELPMPARAPDEPLWMPVADVRLNMEPSKGSGEKDVWVCGRVRRGAIAVGDALELTGAQRWRGQVEELRVAGHAVELARAGEPVEARLVGPGDPPASGAGELLSAPGVAQPRDRLFVEVNVLLADATEPDTRYREGLRAELFVHTAAVGCVVAYERSFPPPARSLQHWIWLDRHVEIPVGAPIVLRDGETIIAYGRAIEPTREWMP